MQRRKFLATVGSLTAASAAALGTGAFSVTAKRDVTVETTSDAEAYLALKGDNDYVTDDSGSGILHIDLGGPDNPNQYMGSGFNKQARTRVEDVITITNQGKNDVSVSVSDDIKHVEFSVNNPVVLHPGNSTTLDAVVNTKNVSNPDDIGGTLTIDASKN